MKNRHLENIGEPVKIIFRKEALEILTSLSNNIFPTLFEDFFKDNYSYAMKAIRVCPHTYFILDEKLQRNKEIINFTIKSFKRHRQIKDINTKTIPLKYNKRRNFYVRG